MRDPQELLTEKETELERVRKEVESLHVVIPLLADDIFEPEPERKPVSNVQATGTEGHSSSVGNSKPKFWRW